MPTASITAVDISEAALAVAGRNAAKHGIAERIIFAHGDLFSSLEADARFDLIVSNPPYVGEGEFPTLQPEVARHEPKLALVSGSDGLDLIRRLIVESPRWLAGGGSLLLEIAPEQAATISSLVAASGRYSAARVVKDLSRADRVVIATGAD